MGKTWRKLLMWWGMLVGREWSPVRTAAFENLSSDFDVIGYTDNLVKRSRVSRVVRRALAAGRKTMEANLDQERQQAHALLDMLSAEKLNAVRSLLEVMVEPLARSLALAAAEEEKITPETAAALDRARASLAQGEGIPHEEILREFGVEQ